jgi:hypothetical protein
VLGDLDRLHAGAETHGGIGLGDTTGHTTNDATTELGGAKAASIELGLGGDEEQDRALGGGFNPGPGNETLVDYRRARRNKSANAFTSEGVSSAAVWEERRVE